MVTKTPSLEIFSISTEVFSDIWLQFPVVDTWVDYSLPGTTTAIVKNCKIITTFIYIKLKVYISSN